MIDYKKYGTIHPITLEVNHYVDNGNLAIEMVTWEEGYAEPWSRLTTNLGDKLESDCAYVDTNNNGEDITSWIEQNGLGIPTGRIGYSGWCEYPEYKFDLDVIKGNRK